MAAALLLLTDLWPQHEAGNKARFVLSSHSSFGDAHGIGDAAPQPFAPGHGSLLPLELRPGCQLGKKTYGTMFILFGVINTKNYK